MRPAVTQEVPFFDDANIGGKNPFFLIAGPCVIESEELIDQVAVEVKRVADKYRVPVVFKASFDKANRSDANSFRGPGLEGLKALRRVGDKYGLKILTDVHDVHEVEKIAALVDVLQIPAFLCRQTDLLLEVARTKKWSNVKKGQFVAPTDAIKIVEKFHKAGNEKICICERGYTFGYNNLVVDMRGIEQMREMGIHVVFDATHSTQLPGGGKESGGQRAMAFPLARAAAATGVDGFFFEVHPNPPEALSDASNQMYLRDLESILSTCHKIDRLVKT